MENRFNLAHECNYSRVCSRAKKGLFASFILFLITIALIAFQNTIDAATVFISVFALVFVLTFLITLAVYGSRAREYGSFEAIDILNNKLIHFSDKNGEMIILPEEIKNIKMLKHSKGGLYDVYINFREDKNAFKIPNTVSHYHDLVEKIEKFADENNIDILK